jgi:alpha-glucosidase
MTISAQRASRPHSRALRPWWHDAVFYQIYPRSFRDSNGDGIGDLDGIAAMLDYLNDGTSKSLGIDAIWLCPIYPSPHRDWGYDISDYCAIDPDLGDLKSFDHLVAEAHRRGIRVILDFVPNHTSDQHPWFRQSRVSRENAKRAWYIWAPGKGNGPPNNWRSAFAGPAWSYDSRTAEWYMHSFLPEQPDLNYRCAEMVEEMHRVMQFWLERGVDGFRIDAVSRLSKDPMLRDNPHETDCAEASASGASGVRVNFYCHDRPEVHELLRGFRRVLDSYGERMMVGEVWPREQSLLRDYLRPDELNLVFNFRFFKSPYSADAFRAAVQESEALCADGAWPTWTLSNHDFMRHISRYESGDATHARARVAAMMLMTLRGTPFIYYGEEIGMRQVDIPPPRRLDPMGRDGCRTPMQWSAVLHGGFTTSVAGPWLPCGDYEKINVASQARDESSLLALYRRLIWLRRQNPTLREGAYRAFNGVAEDCLGFYREGAGRRLLVMLNFAHAPRATESPAGKLILSTEPGRSQQSLAAGLVLGPDEGVVIDLGPA